MSLGPALSWLGEREYERERLRRWEKWGARGELHRCVVHAAGGLDMQPRLKSSQASWSNYLVREWYCEVNLSMQIVRFELWRDQFHIE